MRSERFVGEVRRRGTSRVSGLNTAVTLFSGAGTVVIAVGLAISHAATVHRSLDAQARAEPVTTAKHARAAHPRAHRRRGHHAAPALVVPTPTAVPNPAIRTLTTAPAAPRSSTPPHAAVHLTRATPVVAAPTPKPPAPKPTPVSPPSAPPTATSHGS